MTPEDSDDIWLLYNLISEGDTVECMTFRKVVNESSSGAVDVQKLVLRLAVNVQKLDVDLHSPSIRANGKNVKEDERVNLDSYPALVWRISVTKLFNYIVILGTMVFFY